MATHLAGAFLAGITAGYGCYHAGKATAEYLGTRAPEAAADPEGGTEAFGAAVLVGCLIGAGYDIHHHHIGGAP
jgi:hypothetical protein